jgi:hypothetical protein
MVSAHSGARWTPGKKLSLAKAKYPKIMIDYATKTPVITGILHINKL